jgi:hypothetical protein
LAVILISAHHDEETRQRALNQGTTGFSTNHLMRLSYWEKSSGPLANLRWVKSGPAPFSKERQRWLFPD